MRAPWLLWLALAAAAALPRRTDQDFEFDEDGVQVAARQEGGRRLRRYVYDPHNSLCRSLVCKKREVCLLKDAFTALCATKKEVLRRGDVIVAASASSWDSSWGRDDDDDVFYEGGARDADGIGRDGDGGGRDGDGGGRDGDGGGDVDGPRPDRCVGCESRGGGGGGGGGGGVGAGGDGFLCGSDNRTYSSLCRLDLHNCVRRPLRPVRLACRGFCPCAPHSHSHPHSELGPPAPPPPPTATQRRPNRRNNQIWRRRKNDPARNEVLPPRPFRRRPPPSTLNGEGRAGGEGGGGCALDEMANRLLDWFSVLMEEAGATVDAHAPPEHGFPRECKPEVRWMFSRLDADGDGLLSPDNLYALRHDERERCLRPFLSSCGGGGGGGGGAGVGRAAWCSCLRRASRPCQALARAHPRASALAQGAYVPSCDARGFFRPRQCHAALRLCWCVDAHGVERPHSRTRGPAHCTDEGRATKEAREERGGAPADDEDAVAGEGEADAESEREGNGDSDGEAEAEGEGGADGGSGDAEMRF